MANRFLNNIKINDSYTLPPADGTANQIIKTDGAGQLSFIDQSDVIAGEADKAKSVVLRVKNSTGSAMTKGQVICEAVSASPPSGNLIEVALADNNGTNTMPALGILNEDLDASGGANDEGDAIMFGKVSGIDTSAFSVGDEVFVDDTAGGLTTTKPTGVKYIQKVGVVIRDDASNGTIEVFGAGRVNDVPTPLYIDHANQLLGIGAPSPSAALEVIGDIKIKQGSGYSNYALIDATEALLTLETYSVNTASYPADIIFKPAGTEKMRITDDGNVGIGTTSPDAKLNITAGDNGAALLLEAENSINLWKNITFKTYVSESQAANFSAGSHIYTTSPGGATTWPFTEYGALVIEGRDNGNSGIALRTGNGSGQITRIAIRESGNVGIGTTSPVQKLHVNGIGEFAGALRITETGTSQSILIGNQDSSGVNTPAMINGVNGALRFGKGNSWSGEGGTFTEAMRINPDGNVGIGTTSPVYKLDVNGDGRFSDKLTVDTTVDEAFVLNSTDDGAIYMAYKRNGDRHAYVGFGGSNDQFYITNEETTGSLYFNTVGGGIYVNSNGNVGIGTTSPGQKLDINGDTIFRGQLVIDGDSSVQSRINQTSSYLEIVGNTTDSADGARMWIGTGQTDQGFYVNANYHFFRDNSSNTRMIINSSSGNVGIGTTSPSSKLHVRKAAGPLSSFNSNTIGIFETNGPGYVNIVTGTTSTGELWFSDSSEGRGRVRYDHSDDSLQFWTANGEKLRVGVSGQIGIGGTNYGSSGQVLTSNGANSAPSWQAAGGGGGSYTPNIVSGATTASKDNLYIFTASATLTLPANPSGGDSIKVSNLSGTTTCVIARNTKNIMAVGEDMTLDNQYASFELIYSDATRGWVIIGATGELN